MKSTKRTRWVRHLVVKVRATPHREFTKNIVLRDILKAASEALAKGEAIQRKTPAAAVVHVRIVDIHFNETDSHAVILFRLIDKDGQDSVYEDFDSGEMEAHPKKPTQGNRTTAHLAVALKGRLVGDEWQFNAALEIVSGISRTLIQQRLTSLGRRFGRYVGEIDGKSEEASASFEIVQLVERTIRQELTEGVLQHFTLEHKESADGGFDADRLVKKERRTVSLRVVADPKTKLDAIIKAAKLEARQGDFELIKAHYETPDGRSTSADINIMRQDALEDMVGKVTRVDLEEDVHPNQVSVTPCICKRLIPLAG